MQSQIEILKKWAMNSKKRGAATQKMGVAVRKRNKALIGRITMTNVQKVK